MTSLRVWVVVGLLFAAVVASSGSVEEKNKRVGKIFFKSYSTRTNIALSFITSTLPFTCFSQLATPGTCSGRKRRQVIPAEFEDSEAVLATRLNSSLNGEFRESRNSPNNRKPKIIFTLWSTTTSTITATTYITNRSVTLSLLAICTFPGSVYNLC